MAKSGPTKQPAAWLLTADRYLAEITEAERIEALAAAAIKRPKTRPVMRLVHTASAEAR